MTRPDRPLPGRHGWKRWRSRREWAHEKRPRDRALAYIYAHAQDEPQPGRPARPPCRTARLAAETIALVLGQPLPRYRRSRWTREQLDALPWARTEEEQTKRPAPGYTEVWEVVYEAPWCPASSPAGRVVWSTFRDRYYSRDKWQVLSDDEYRHGSEAVEERFREVMGGAEYRVVRVEYL